MSASVFTITAIVMSQNMKRPSLPSPAGSQARSIFSGGLFQVGTPDQLSTSLVSCRNFKIFQYTISTQCAYLFTIKLWQNKRGDMQNIGEERGAGTVFMFLHTLSEKMNIIFMECQILLAFIHPNSPQPLQVPVLSLKYSGKGDIFTDIEGAALHRRWDTRRCFAYNRTPACIGTWNTKGDNEFSQSKKALPSLC